MNITLYQAAQELQQKIYLSADEDGVIDMEKVGEIEAQFEDRAIATTAVIKTFGISKEGLLAQKKAINEQFDKQIKSIESNEQRLKDYLLNAMKATGTLHVKSNDGLLDAKLYLERDKSVLLEDGAEFPIELCNPPKKPEPSKKLIKEAILRGEPIAGAQIIRKDRLEIR